MPTVVTRYRWLTTVLAVAGLVALSACSTTPSSPPIGTRQSALCNPNNGGGDLGCGCTDNTQCTNFDNDTRLIVCNVPTNADGGTVGACFDCFAATSNKPIGCACETDSDCASPAYCDVRTCQLVRVRGELCFLDSECGTDDLGAMSCLLTKHWCGPLPDGYSCDFNTDCINKNCATTGLCTSGTAGSNCTKDSDCATGLVCSEVTLQCISPQADGALCARNAECINQCNSFSGHCLLGSAGVICTPANPAGDCIPTLTCAQCSGTYTCRTPGGPCG